ncbi:FtsK/SpoIIIE domain-containing protein [Demequina sp.]|uniref:FtsK/SpoIIIE domain-containing protein n=1 Tax=Demequina sp. TaxID=2050685 RepID=UPI0025B945CB|nr:FtsK/SpoIIIE domain-containing protein [Demequina sp.]
MRLTIDRSLTDTHDVELHAAVGTSLAEVLGGNTSKRAWCGSTLLEPSHRVGNHPLLEGARLRDGPGEHTAPLAGLHLAAIAGPDAGVIIAVDGPVTVGSASGRQGIRDDAMNPSHLVVEPAADGGLSCADAGSTNGTVWWRHDGERWWWWGSRRRFTAHQGDVIGIGTTALQVRGGASAPQAHLRRRVSLTLARWLAALPWTPTPDWQGLPDPTTVGAWTGSATITGPHAREATRAMILARGRRPPSPAPFEEEWLRWLPAALPTDGTIRCGSSQPADVSLEARATSTLISGVANTEPRLPIAVSRDRADALARAIAGAAPPPWPKAVRWADLDQPGELATEGPPLRVALGVLSSPHLETWTLRLDDSTPHLLVAGARRSGASTLLATLVAGLASHYDPCRLRVTLIGTGTEGPLAPCANLPHVTCATVSSGGGDALHVLEGAVHEARGRREALFASGLPDWRTWESSGGAPGRLLVVVDDFDEATGSSHAAAAAIEALTGSQDFVGVHVALATHRPAGAITASLRANCAHAVALRCASESDSLGVVGVPDAARWDDNPGRGVARTLGALARVQVALPTAERSPRVHLAGAEVTPAPHLADAVARGVVANRGRQEAAISPLLP